MIDFDVVVEAVPDGAGTLEVPDYLPPAVDAARHPIALVGCGGISGLHLSAYRAAGFTVTALCDRTPEKARARRDEFFPGALATDSLDRLLADPNIDIIDVATHVNGRAEIISRALRAGKNVLSQKPFVRDLDEGAALVRLSAETGRLLAVNHNGRWAPHFAVALAAVARGDIGEVTSADFDVYWPHDRVVESEPAFATMFDLLVYDFGIHWFDVVAQLTTLSGDPASVFANAAIRRGQRIAAPTDLDVLMVYPTARAGIRFRGSAPRAESGSYRIEGTHGVIRHSGTSLGGESVLIDGAAGSVAVNLAGDWWSNGMTGTMAELMTAIDEQRQPRNSAQSSLPGLALCFAAMQSIRTQQPVDAGAVRRAPEA